MLFAMLVSSTGSSYSGHGRLDVLPSDMTKLYKKPCWLRMDYRWGSLLNSIDVSGSSGGKANGRVISWNASLAGVTRNKIFGLTYFGIGVFLTATTGAGFTFFLSWKLPGWYSG